MTAVLERPQAYADSVGLVNILLESALMHAIGIVCSANQRYDVANTKSRPVGYERLSEAAAWAILIELYGQDADEVAGHKWVVLDRIGASLILDDIEGNPTRALDA